LEDLREADEEVEVDIYEESAPLTFTRSQQKVAIFEYQIVCDVQVTEDVKPAPKKRGAAAGPSYIKINRQQFNKVNRQMENAGKYPLPVGFILRCVSFFGKIQIAEFCAIIFAVNLNLNYSEENRRGEKV
jgi:hypothetical protein